MNDSDYQVRDLQMSLDAMTATRNNLLVKTADMEDVLRRVRERCRSGGHPLDESNLFCWSCVAISEVLGD